MNFKCKNCGAALTVEGTLRTVVCAFCASPSVVERPESESGPRPTFTLGFVQPEKDVQQHVAKWLKTRNLFCPSSVRNAKVEELQGVYVPAFLYSAVSRSEYTAQIGENYTVTETYTTTDSQGRTVTRTRTRIETEWRSLRGSHSANVVDVLVTASKGLSNPELEAVEPFDWRALRRYSPAMISGWLAEDASMTNEQCMALAQQEAIARIGATLNAFMPGDMHRDLRHNTWLENEAVDLVLVPVWLLNARYEKDKPPIRIVVNGQTGAIHGKPPLSWIKISAAVLLGLLVIAVLYLLANGGAR